MEHLFLFICTIIFSFLNIEGIQANNTSNFSLGYSYPLFSSTKDTNRSIFCADNQSNMTDLLLAMKYRIPNIHLNFSTNNNILYALQRYGSYKYTVTVKDKDNLSSLCNTLGLNQSVALKLSKVPNYGTKLINMKPGENLEFWISSSGYLMQLDYLPDPLNRICFYRDKLNFSAKFETILPKVKLCFTQGVITDSLFADCKKLGIPAKLISQLTNIFGWDIDFVQDVRCGDEFHIIYEEEYINGSKFNDGDIIVATFINRGKSITAIRYTDAKGNCAYYRTDGKSMKKAFLRTPVEFTRISSKFNPSRLHPIFKTIHPHHGVDYAAPMNTPIRASGDGVVLYAGWMNGYGNVVKLQHPQNIVTVYAHANSIKAGIKKGKKVKQGDIIATVGKTGWATGTHLHYEFQVAGVHRNPETVQLPDALPIKGIELDGFKQFARKMLQLFEHHKMKLVDNNLSGYHLHNLNLILN